MLPLLMWLLENLKYIWDTLLVYNVMLQNTSPNNAWFIKTHTHRHQDEALDWNLTHPPTGLKSHTHTHTHQDEAPEWNLSLSLTHTQTPTHTQDEALDWNQSSGSTAQQSAPGQATALLCARVPLLT